MDWSIQHYSPELGPVGVGFASPHLTVGSLGNVRVSLLGPPQPLTVVSVKAVLRQQFAIRYRDGNVVKPEMNKYTLLKVDQRASPSLVIPLHNPATCKTSPGVGTSTPNPPLASEAYRSPSTCCHIEPDVPIPDPSPLARVNVGDEFHHSRVCRIPTDNLVRASTLPGSNALISELDPGDVTLRSGDS